MNIENRTLTRITSAAECEQHRLFNGRALRKALINAIIHNDYTAEVQPLVEIYADRISITSYGGLVSGLSLAECLAGRSMPRNRELMRIFRDPDLAEQIGSGVARILSAYGSSIFHISEHFFEMRFPMEGRTPAESGAESGALKLLFLFQAAPLSKSELARELGINGVTGALNRSVNVLLEQAMIERTLPDKPQSRLQKYRLTQAGRQWLELAGAGDQKAVGGIAV